MNREEEIKTRIAEAYRKHNYIDHVSFAEMVTGAMQYRASLSVSDRELYDEMILEGAYPGNAAELIEVISGRDAQRTGRQTNLSGNQIAEAA